MAVHFCKIEGHLQFHVFVDVDVLHLAVGKDIVYSFVHKR